MKSGRTLSFPEVRNGKLIVAGILSFGNKAINGWIESCCCLRQVMQCRMIRRDTFLALRIQNLY